MRWICKDDKMEVRGTILFICLCLSFIEEGRSIRCYHCHQTTKDCMNAVKDKLDKIDCPQSECFVLKYETEMPGVVVQAVYRGCHNKSKLEMMQSVTTPNHKTREKEFNLCNKTLCNNAWKSSSSVYLLPLLVLYPIYIP